MSVSKKSNVQDNTMVGYIIAFTVGVLVGLRISPEFVAVPYLMLAAACIFFALQNEPNKVFSILPYIIYTEMFIRAYVTIVPYLFMPYLYIALFTVLFLRNSTQVKIHSKSFILFLLFFVIEAINYTRAELADAARGLMINTIMLALITIWSSFNFLRPGNVYQILKHIKYASIYLCGIVLARYMVGDVVFSGVSGSEGTNGLAPVQISGYLGFSCTVFFFSIMNGTEVKHLAINIVLLCISATIMLLSFSRGGLYFVAIMMILYFWFNRGDVKRYFLFLLLVPFSVLVYFYVYDKTNGLLAERYEMQGSSGRDELIKAGWKIFLSDPLVGVGLGNFYKEVVDRKLYQQESGAHNEFVRVGAEDGLLGVITYWGFFISLFFEIWKRKKIEREYAVYFLIFFCLICVHNGLKISIQPLLMMLAIATPSLTVNKRKKLVRDQQQLKARLV